MKLSWRWMVLAGAAALAALAALSGPTAAVLGWVHDRLPGVGPAGVILYALVYATAPLLLLPTLPFSFGAGIIFGVWRGFVAVMLGSVLTASAGFLLSRYLLRGGIEPRLRTRPKYAAIDRMVAREGWKIVGLIRLTWLHCGFSNYAFGLTAIRFRPYLLISIAALAPGNIVSVSVGAAGAVGYEALVHGQRERTTAELVMLGLGVAAALAAGLFVATRAKRASRRPAGSTPDPDEPCTRMNPAPCTLHPEPLTSRHVTCSLLTRCRFSGVPARTRRSRAVRRRCGSGAVSCS
jgi:uncharacterized membrane protein YdjX (TVP38/TMEM64 family)